MPRSRSFNSQKGFATLLLVGIVIVAGVVLAGFGGINKGSLRGEQKRVGEVIPQPPQSSKDNLQLKPLAFTSPTENVCAHDGSVDGGCSCPATQIYGGLYHTNKPEPECYFVAPDKVNDECTLLKLCEQNVGTCSWGSSAGCIVPRDLSGDIIEPDWKNNPNAVPQVNCAAWKARFLSEPNKHFCVGKPVIYLYPEEPTHVDVKLSIPGDIYISIPKYPDEGWLDVLAYPDGTLVYENKKYKELYYETEVEIKKTPTNGIIISMKNLRPELAQLVTKLGLKPSERDEFLEYWMPLLTDLKKPFIVFSLLDQVEKERIDGVYISPTPDVFINFIAYFRGVDKPYDIEPLTLPVPPERTGFTAVEWGGTIDPESFE